MLWMTGLMAPSAYRWGGFVAIDMLPLVREAVGDKADLLFGTHGQLTPSAAIRLARRLESSDPLWFEEPVPPEKPDSAME